LELLLVVVVPKAVLLLVVALAVVVPLGVVVLVGVELLPLKTIGDEVGGVTALEEALRRSPPLLTELVYGVELSCQQYDLIVWDALVLLIRSCDQRRQSKL
jgi:hypothetical protein